MSLLFCWEWRWVVGLNAQNMGHVDQRWMDFAPRLVARYDLRCRFVVYQIRSDLTCGNFTNKLTTHHCVHVLVGGLDHFSIYWE